MGTPGARPNPFNPQPLISHLTNSNGYGNLQSKVLQTLSPLPPSFNRNSACIRSRYALPTIDDPCSPLFSFHALINPSYRPIDLQVLSFHTLTNPFSRNPFPFSSIQNPGGWRRPARSSTPRSLCLPARQAGLSVEELPNSFPDIPLRTLEISLRSFSTSRPLFSIVCGLLLQITGGMGVAAAGPPCTAHPSQITATATTFRINTCKSVSKQTTLSPFRMNTCEKTRGGEVIVN